MMLYCRLLGAVLLVCTGFAAGQAYCQRLWAQWRAVCGFERLLTYLADQLAFCALPSAELLAAAAEHPAFAAYCPPNAASFAELRLPRRLLNLRSGAACRAAHHCPVQQAAGPADHAHAGRPCATAPPKASMPPPSRPLSNSDRY